MFKVNKIGNYIASHLCLFPHRGEGKSEGVSFNGGIRDEKIKYLCSNSVDGYIYGVVIFTIGTN